MFINVVCGKEGKMDVTKHSEQFKSLFIVLDMYRPYVILFVHAALHDSYINYCHLWF